MPAMPAAQQGAGTDLLRVHGLQLRVARDPRSRKLWSGVASRDWQPHTFEVLARFLAPDRSCIDVGAGVGQTALYSARLSKQVYAIEPDQQAFDMLRLNLDSNPELHSRVALFRNGAAAGALAEFADTYRINDCNFIKLDLGADDWAALSGPVRWSRGARPTVYLSFRAQAGQARRDVLGAGLELLQLSYRRLYDSHGRPLDAAAMVSAAVDWNDQSAGSPRSALDKVIARGIVASDQAW